MSATSRSPTCAAVARATEDVLPVALNLGRVLADKATLQFADRGRHGEALAGERAFAEAGDALVGEDLDEDVVLVVARIDEDRPAPCPCPRSAPWRSRRGIFSARQLDFRSGGCWEARPATACASTATRVNSSAAQAEGWTCVKGGFFPVQRNQVNFREAIREGVEHLARVRDAVGPDFDIIVEIHGKAGPAAAVEFCNRVEEFRPLCVEEARKPPPQAPPEKCREGIALWRFARAHRTPTCSRSAAVRIDEKVAAKFPYQEKAVSSLRFPDGSVTDR